MFSKIRRLTGNAVSDANFVRGKKAWVSNGCWGTMHVAFYEKPNVHVFKDAESVLHLREAAEMMEKRAEETTTPAQIVKVFSEEFDGRTLVIFTDDVTRVAVDGTNLATACATKRVDSPEFYLANVNGLNDLIYDSVVIKENGVLQSIVMVLSEDVWDDTDPAWEFYPAV